jgi:hypothetical protein
MQRTKAEKITINGHKIGAACPENSRYRRFAHDRERLSFAGSRERSQAM